MLLLLPSCGILGDDEDEPRFQPGNDIHAKRAWFKNRGRNDVTVAVVDGGVDYNHPDLDPGDRSRVIDGYDTADNDGNPMDDIPAGEEFAGHGTKVAGVVGAITNNDQQVAGIMWNTKIMPVKIAYTDGPWFDPFHIFSGPGSAFRTNIGQGIDYARNHGADIVTLSLGSPAEDAPGDLEVLLIGNTEPGGTSVQLAPTWSPSGEHIVYGSGKGPTEEPPGAKGTFSLYVLKNVN